MQNCRAQVSCHLLEDAKRFAGIVIIAVSIAVTVVRGQIPGSPAVSASCSKAQITRLSIDGLILIEMKFYDWHDSAQIFCGFD